MGFCQSAHSKRQTQFVQISLGKTRVPSGGHKKQSVSYFQDDHAVRTGDCLFTQQLKISVITLKHSQRPTATACVNVASRHLTPLHPNRNLCWRIPCFWLSLREPRVSLFLWRFSALHQTWLTLFPLCVVSRNSTEDCDLRECVIY